MKTFKFNLVLVTYLLTIFKVSLLETVHFTNSPNKILHANNYTTYKVAVPNGESITIIEANTPLINKKIRFNEVENTKYSINHNRDIRKNVMDLKTSLSMTVTPNNNNNDEYRSLQPSNEEESVTNDYGNLSPEQNIHQNTMKTVYSPALLEKFLKDYANKIRSTERPITELTTASYEEIKPFKDVINDKNDSLESQDDGGNRRVSVEEDETQSDDVQERKRYRPGNENYQQHPYNKKNGWVTLEAIPWSKSKVSKWQSSVKPYQNNYRPTRPPPYNYEEDYNSNDNEDHFYSHKPQRPSYQNNQYYGGQSSSYPNRPDQTFSQSSHHNNYDNDYRPNRPYQPEIITDNRPSNFPTHHETSHHQNEYGYNRPNNYDRPSRPPSDYHYSSSQNYNHYSNKDDSAHPSTYPSSGVDGEWVLISTTKGYQFPKRNGQRAMMFKAQNSAGSTETMKNEDNGIISSGSHQYNNFVSLRPSQIAPTKMTQQQVKLNVLPLFQSSTYNKKSPNQMELNLYKPNTNYGGLIETEPSTQTVEESAAAAGYGNELNSVTTVAQNSPKKKRKPNKKNYALMRQNNGDGDSTAVLAAVSAGLLPASLGLLAPIVLG
ncbi:CLUMA_CG017030, isoform A [Clunio marinus]|uniref:CLUMA_CG017030, isoform A n=1 Tax=Clunio marinus TaxID=568069 RepID=A0A1J1IUL4_9DIPT|nr:CLUMA_CG017030, isoform A [Clunio marinus]